MVTRGNTRWRKSATEGKGGKGGKVVLKLREMKGNWQQMRKGGKREWTEREKQKS